jgi:FAD-dependent monooxygenase
LGAEHTLSSWDLPSVDKFREQIAAQNDGTMPVEPWGRISGDVVEADLKERCEKDPLIEIRCGWTVVGATETENGAEIKVIDPEGRERSLRSAYAVGCEGAASVVRKSLGIEMVGGQM